MRKGLVSRRRRGSSRREVRAAFPEAPWRTKDFGCRERWDSRMVGKMASLKSCDASQHDFKAKPETMKNGSKIQRILYPTRKKHTTRYAPYYTPIPVLKLQLGVLVGMQQRQAHEPSRRIRLCTQAPTLRRGRWGPQDEDTNDQLPRRHRPLGYAQ